MKNRIKYSFIETNKYEDIKAILKDTYKVKEYKVWYDGNISELLAFYKQDKNNRNRIDSLKADEIYTNHNVFTPSFYKLAPSGYSNNIGGFYQMNNFTVYHNPVANVISRAKSDLIASTAPLLTASITNKKRETERFQGLIEEIASENNYETAFQNEVELASFSGGVAYKPILDPEFSELPLYQTYHKGQFILNKKYDKTVSIVFMDYYEDKDNKYTLYSEHGKGFVKYLLVDKDNIQVPLNKVSELEALRDLYFYDENNKPLNLILGVYVENKPGFRSDYENSMDDFQALDENYSKMMDFLRKTTATRVVSESTLKQTETGEAIIPSVYDSNFLIKWDNTANNENSVNELQALPDVNNPIQGYINAMNQIYHQISTVSGLSTKTLSGADYRGANESGEALLVRENQDLKTRENMVVIYSTALKKLYKLLLILTTAEYKGENIYVNSLEDLEVTVEFYNPASPTFKQLAEEVSFLLDNGLIDNYGALERLWIDTGKKTEEEVKEMLSSIEGRLKTYEDFIDETKQDIITEEESEEEENDD